MKLVGRIVDSIVLVCGYLSGWLVVGMMLLILVEVFMRYGLNQPPMIADEFGAYLVVVVVFLGVGYTWKEKGHVRITALVGSLPQKVSSWIRLIALVLALVFSIMLTQASYSYLAFSFKINMASLTVHRFPLQGPQMTIPIGYTLLCLLIIMEIAKAITNISSGRSVDQGENR